MKETSIVALYSNRNDGPCAGLSLCAGYGGLDLGLVIAEPGYRTVGFVERQAHAASALVARMEDKALHPAPIWDDLTTFDGQHWRGKVDCILAGYPCQPFSAAGKRQAEADPRHLWPHVRRIIADTSAAWVLLENVEGHLDRGFLDVARDLSGMGFEIEAGLFSAHEVGAAHWRRRLFMLAYADGVSRQPLGSADHSEESDLPCADRRSGQSDLHRGSREELDSPVAVSEGNRMETGECAAIPLFAPAPLEFQVWNTALTKRPDLQPCLHGLADGLADRVDRSRAAGNGVCSLAAAYAWRTLKARLMRRLE